MRATPPHQNGWRLAVVRGVLLGLVLIVVFLAGFYFREALAVISPGLALADPPEKYMILSEVHALLDAHYLRDLPDPAVLEYAAIRGMLGALNDPYTFFIDPPVARSESDVLAGQYGGIGVMVQHAADGNFELYPFVDSPAAQAGIEDGDVLLAIDDWVIEATARIDEIDQAMRGEVGNGVTLHIRRRSTGEAVEIAVEFAVIAVPSVVWRPLVQEPRIGYIQVLRFTSRTPDELRMALQELQALDLDGWIVDVRNNSGGLLQEAIEVADEFLDDGIIVYEQTRTEENDYTATAGGLGIDLPMVVLVNHGTASAAELVAGALQDQSRATVIGQATYGKGTVQLIFPLSDGSSMHVTSAEWFTPNRTPLESNGLQPDVSMIPAEDGRDVELDEAIRVLRQQFE